MQTLIFISIFLAIICFVIFSIRLKWWLKDIDYKIPRVLMYHMIANHLPKNKSKFNRLRVSPKSFEKQLIWLKKNGFKSYFLSELSPNLEPKSVVITFDDGYKDNFTNALPLLKKYGFKATIFIVCNRFDNNWASDKDLKKPSPELNAEEMLSDDEVKMMIESGFIEIGSHTLNHANLPSLSLKEKEMEIKNSKSLIEEKFGITCKSFAYPFGFYDKNDIILAKNSGYKFATTTTPDVVRSKYSNFEIPRLMISGRGNLLHFILKIKKGRSR
ncbi:polysaccharide deacetylase [Campylobacter sputorum subsp. bubulus]|uniref:Polysaccharide deacetylase n=1 Tax=Campylobacter sputorum subsp. sputorum TaxID=32024 RepID=A0A381DHV4_9BACT|nr:polysaccharide deacetylase family protein [Campylobacter sputorum]ASM35117.1 polysaccharide deacetylase [Campylobacter sputorum aubsp. sputorum RM3237]KAB0581282.1 polysaccharide deacetylase family protein [Campylobacter sputorum subsp. sputorum]QEL05307.1 polysaccharide deacetylase [Campylobacter sputorum subsp. sputorum]SUX08893.1 polysaccharide deacetylase [Campylobacter sputorum subsp. bubulus]SUX09858.1 polysaccharide deacetylase [Campylobacter sputorum subsp. sputorum]